MKNARVKTSALTTARTFVFSVKKIIAFPVVGVYANQSIWMLFEAHDLALRPMDSSKMANCFYTGVHQNHVYS